MIVFLANDGTIAIEDFVMPAQSISQIFVTLFVTFRRQLAIILVYRDKRKAAAPARLDTLIGSDEY